MFEALVDFLKRERGQQKSMANALGLGLLALSLHRSFRKCGRAPMAHRDVQSPRPKLFVGLAINCPILPITEHTYFLSPTIGC